MTSEAPLTTTYGMPLMYIYDKTGSVVATETATSVSSDSTQATFPFPSTLPQSGYSTAIVNQIGTGDGFAPAGTNLLSIASSQTIAGNPFGVAATAMTVNSKVCISGVPSCTTSSSTSTTPLLSLYSAGQVLVGDWKLAVGANPTAVAVYSAGPVTDVYTTSGAQTTITYSGTTRGIVSNSGSNTVSIVDIPHHTVIGNITVGSNPVALAVSQDGSTAYVANYTDSTVTQVNLKAGTPASTIAVGGQPTSVALTAAGTMWVGGAGFLTEVNTQNMSVVATQSTAGKTIAALGFSNGQNELVATSMDTSGNVFVDEVAPSGVHSGAPYAAVASHSVSTLGTYFNTRAQAQVRGFTAMAATSSGPINTDQTGAPPLVVQDGWAVVTATPTGFTITDISGHEVLVSEATPSPIAAIAVDTNLSVVYLTMPDSNTLLTVPLPGVNSQ